MENTVYFVCHKNTINSVDSLFYIMTYINP